MRETHFPVPALTDESPFKRPGIEWLSGIEIFPHTDCQCSIRTEQLDSAQHIRSVFPGGKAIWQAESSSSPGRSELCRLRRKSGNSSAIAGSRRFHELFYDPSYFLLFARDVGLCKTQNGSARDGYEKLPTHHSGHPGNSRSAEFPLNPR